jgi:hypothetical protein
MESKRTTKPYDDRALLAKLCLELVGKIVPPAKV